MYISKFRIENYKSFRDSSEIEFKPGINIIVGQNNSGKTALLEVLSQKYEEILHKSEKSNWNSGSQIYAVVNQSLLVQISREETIKILKEPLFDYFISDISFENYNITKTGEKDIFDLGVKVKLINKKLSFLNFGSYIEKSANRIPTPLIYIRDSDNRYFHIEEMEFRSHFPGRSATETLGEKFAQYVFGNIYMLKSERMDIARCSFGSSRELKNNAKNLGEVLHSVKANNSYLFQQYLNLVKEVIPSIYDISIPLETIGEMNALNFEIRIWLYPSHLQMENLVIPLSQCGTGVSQVLSILFIILVNKDRPKIIIIDEPNSFLHPSASQKLIQILNRFPQHQYFISTHSPEIVTASNPATITMLDYIDGETKVEQIDLSNAKGVKKVFADLGVKPSTFAFANHILWVEGLTEVKAFSKILEHANINNVVIKPTVPSEFRQSKKRFENVRHIFNLHKEISGTNSVISPKMTILLDKEIGKETQNEDLIREFGKEIFNFLRRAMYENYLLYPKAIAYILNFTKETEEFQERSSEFGVEDTEINAEKVKNFIEDIKQNKEFLPENLKSEKDLSEEKWLENVDGAKLLDKLFKHFLGNPFGYAPHKIEYGEKLTEWLLENKPAQLAELEEFLVKILLPEK